MLYQISVIYSNLPFQQNLNKVKPLFKGFTFILIVWYKVTDSQ